MLEPSRAMSLVLIQLYKLIIAVIFNFIRSELMEVIFLFLFFLKLLHNLIIKYSFFDS
jgi:hypothetical protein